MILMWLGSFVLVLWGLRQSRAEAAILFAGLQKRFYARGLEGIFSSMLQRILGVVFLEASPQRSLYSALSFYNMRILKQRPAILMMCLSTLGAWWILVLGLLYLNVSGLFFLGIGFLLFIPLLNGPLLSPFLKWIAMTGLFLLGGEMMLRQGSILPMLLGTSEWAFFLSDGRILAVLGLLLTSLILSLLIEEEFWVVPLALSLVISNTVSLNGALGIFAGERLARVLLFWWRSRVLNQECRRVGWQFSLSSGLGVLVGLFGAGAVRSEIAWGFSGSEGMQDKILIVILLFVLILFCQFVAQMLWGHFGSRVKVDEMQEGKYFKVSWGQKDLLSHSGLAWARARVHQRLSEIRYHLQGLETVKPGQIPDVLQARLKTEEQQLSQLENEVLKSLG